MLFEMKTVQKEVISDNNLLNTIYSYHPAPLYFSESISIAITIRKNFAKSIW